MLITLGRDATVLYSSQDLGGFSSDAIRGSNMFNFVPRQHQELFRNALERVFRTGESTGYEIADAPEEGKPTLHVIRFGPLRENGKVVAATLLSLDVSDSGP